MTTQGVWAKIHRFPPVLVRLLAKHRDGDAMSDLDIVMRASLNPNTPGLTLADVRRLSLLTSWDSVSVALLRAFTIACGVDFAHREQMRNANRYLNTDPKFSHLTRDPNFPAFREMLKVYYDSQTT